MISTAFILGAGLGTRLRPLTENCPKPLLPIAGKPMICHAMDRLIDAGVERFIVNTHHCAGAYDNFFSDKFYRGKKIIFAHEPVLLDTGGGLKNIEQFLNENDAHVYVYNGDIFAFPALEKLARAHISGDAEATLLLRSQGEPLNVKVNAAGEITDMRGRLAGAGDARLFAGIYIVRRKFFAHLAAKNKSPEIESVVEAFLRRIVAAPGSIRGITDDSGAWHDLGTVAEYESVRQNAGEDFSKKIVAQTPVEKGGSGRQFFRVRLDDGTGGVLCRYDNSREENALYAAIARFLAKINFPVPRIIAEKINAAGTGEILLEDCGATDLHALQNASPEERRRAYEAALRALHKLHWGGGDEARRAAGDVRLMPGFDEKLYKWEREYFLENAVKLLFEIKLSGEELGALECELAALAARLQALPTQLVHRDCQSQNILWRAGEVRFIDFQGMRTGTGFYDLASLLWDPYVKFGYSERAALIEFYRNLGMPESVRANFDQALRDAAAQRLMQALGAYGFLGIVRGKKEFLEHVSPALANLEAVTRENPELPLLRALVRRVGALLATPATRLRV